MQGDTTLACMVLLLLPAALAAPGHQAGDPPLPPSAAQAPTPPPPPPTPVLFDHDGGVDDYVTLLILLSDPAKVDVIGITILDADCHADVAANTTRKLLRLLGRQHIPVAVSTLPAVNPFPPEYRAQGLSLDVLPVLNQQQQQQQQQQVDRQLQERVPGQEVFAQLLLRQPGRVTVVATGPLSNLAYALDRYPQVADKVERVWWMGGALRVPGNVHQPHTDGSAEWNAFWDPAALGVVWGSSVRLTMVPLDGTNKVPITPDLVYSFGPQAHHLYSNLAGTFYAPVVNWVYTSPGEPYYGWDALTAACMLEPTMCKVETDLQVAAVLAGPAQGATVLAEPQSQQAASSTPTTAAAPHAAPAAVLHLPEPGQQQPGLEPGGLGAQPGLERVLLGSPAGAGHKSEDPGEGGGVVSVQGTDVTPHLSAVKAVSAVVDVDAAEFNRYILERFRQ